MIRGPLGSGKTTISRRVAEALPARYISIDRLLDEHQLEQWENDFISERSFLRANDIAIREAEGPLHEGTPVVIDGNFYWRSVLDDLAARLDYPHLVVTLRVPLDVCIDRDSRRPSPIGAEDTRMVFEKSTSFDYGLPVDASGSVDQAVGAIMEGLRSARLLVPRADGEV